MKTGMRTWWVVALNGWCCASVHAQTGGYSFAILNSEIDGSSARAIAYAISGDGQVIGGGDTRYQDGEQPFIWRKSDGVWVRTQLPVPPAGIGTPQNRGRAMTMSFSGDVIGGMAGDLNAVGTPNFGRPAIWRNVLSGQPELILIEANGIERGYVGGVSSIGDQAAWFSLRAFTNPPFQGVYFQGQVFSWENATQTSVVRAPAVLPAEPNFAMASLFPTHAMSGDGLLIGMTSRFNDYNIDLSRVFGWDRGEVLQLSAGPASLDSPVTGGGPHRQVQAVSQDGSVVVGLATDFNANNSTTRAIRWTRWGEISVLPLIRPFSTVPARYSQALAVSGDGQVIAGSQHYQLPWPGIRSQMQDSRAVVWINGWVRTLENILSTHDVSTNGVVPAVITDISSDGSTLVGIALSNAATDSPLVSFVATILPPGICDDIDFNRDGSRFDPVDIDAFLSVYSEGPCLPAGAQCRDIDFNNDGSLFDPRDIEAFLSVFSEGPCL